MSDKLEAKFRRWLERLNSPTSKAVRGFSYLLTLLLTMRYGLGVQTSDPAFTIVGVSGGWLVAFLSNRWNAQAGSIENARATAYREIAPRIVEARRDLARAAALVVMEIRADAERSGPAVDGYGHSKRGAAIFEMQAAFEKANESVLHFLTVWDQSRLLHKELMQLGWALFRLQRQLMEDWDIKIVALRIVASGGKAVPPTPARSYVEGLNELDDLVMRQAAFLYDFGTYLQNAAYGPLLGSELPERTQTGKWPTLRQFVEASRNEKGLPARSDEVG